jgi:hypothetical protein
MNYITHEQFKKHFVVQGATLAVTPSASLCARSIGHSVYYHSYEESNLSKNKRKYDTVLLDIPDGLKFPGYKSRHEYAWLRLALSHVKQDGVVYVKSSTKILPQIRQFAHLFVENIEFLDNSVYLKCVITSEDKIKTVVTYPTGEKIQIDAKNSILPQNYNQKHLDYVNLVDSSNQDKPYLENVCVGGKQRNLFFDLYEESKEKGTHGLLIQNNTKKLQVSKLEDQSCNSSADVYLFDSKERRDSYFDVLCKYDIIKLADNLACGGEMNKKVQSYLMNPLIFNYAISG